MPKSCKEGAAANQRKSGSEGPRFETLCQQGIFILESLLKSTRIRKQWNAINSKQIVRWRYLSRMKKDSYSKAEKYFSLIQNAAG